MNVRQENYWLFLFSASSFSFPHPENCHIIFVFSRLFFPQPWKLSEYNFMLWIKSILILLLITLCVNCRCFICLPCSVPSFFLWHGFPFCLLSWTASHSMPPQVQNHGLFLPIPYHGFLWHGFPFCLLSYFASSCYHRPCRNAWDLMEFKVLLVYKWHCLLSLV
jgi:hypothetical protein